ncbi:hypothetical protein [Citrobacter enshiensis]|uniref:Cytoplasmic protein n=1 Tax=Citrobacter enshiensis TaxID=2971264 RepID=A0ABT8PXU3_9ENTR|nr:hypothetical protein [Citrobacter enshiensis]MDN8600843.1 hypothetical protein [Citrobacter enshiensis]WET40783.1 hypothetical protein P2W74_00560 [Citrobacter enshiensis]
MGKIGENASALIDKTVDFMASSQAFREYLNKTPPRNVVPAEVPQENVQMYLQRLEYYRQIYKPKREENQ